MMPALQGNNDKEKYQLQNEYSLVIDIRRDPFYLTHILYVSGTNSMANKINRKINVAEYVCCSPAVSCVLKTEKIIL